MTTDISMKYTRSFVLLLILLLTSSYSAFASSVSANDNFANRAPLTTTVYGNNQYATHESGEPFHNWAYDSGKSVWWTWTAPVSGNTTLNVSTSYYAPIIAVYTGTAVNSLTWVASTSSYYYGASLSFNAVRGTAYQIAVDGSYSNDPFYSYYYPWYYAGSIQLSVTPPPGPHLSLPELVVSARQDVSVPVQLEATGDENSVAFSVNFDATALKFNGAKMAGLPVQVDSSQAANGQVGLTVSQAAGQTFAAGSQELVELDFTPLIADGDLNLSFGDTPVARLTTDLSAVSIDSTYSDGSLGLRTHADITLSSDPQDSGTETGAGTFLVGSIHTIKAKAAPGWVFAQWDDGNLSPTRRVEVTPDGAEYTAVFKPSPAQWRGAYVGRLDSGNPSLAKVTLNRKGGFTASIQINGHDYRFHGTLDGNGTYDKFLSSPQGWEVTLSLNTYDGTFQGTVHYGGTSSNFNLTRSMKDSQTDASGVQGNYTFMLTPNYNDSSQPLAIGFGSATVSKTGAVRLIGKLADGTGFSQSTFLTQNGSLQVYTPLYSSTGYLSGDVAFEYQDSSDIDGSLSWVKPPRTKDRLYPSGISTTVYLQGSFFNPKESFSNDFVNSYLNFSDGNQNTVFKDRLLLTKGSNQLGTVLTLNNQAAWFQVNPHTGWFSGDLFGVYRNGGGRQVNTPFQGVILQKTLQGGGFFFDGTTNGEVDIYY